MVVFRKPVSVRDDSRTSSSMSAQNEMRTLRERQRTALNEFGPLRTRGPSRSDSDARPREAVRLWTGSLWTGSRVRLQARIDMRMRSVADSVHAGLVISLSGPRTRQRWLSQRGRTMSAALTILSISATSSADSWSFAAAAFSSMFFGFVEPWRSEDVKQRGRTGMT